MIQKFIKQNRHDSLLLFFAGWGMDENPFKSLTALSKDICICYDYTDLSLNPIEFGAYNSIDIYAWSLGVWCAASVLSGYTGLPVCRKTAINGTMFPIDAVRGIDPKIFNATLDNLDERSLFKFNRRMCYSADNFQEFSKNTPLRTIPSLRNELRSIQTHIYESPTLSFIWDNVIIGANDLIFPAENQKKAWKEIEITLTEEAHFFNFKKYIHDNR